MYIVEIVFEVIYSEVDVDICYCEFLCFLVVECDIVVVVSKDIEVGVMFSLICEVVGELL